MFDAWKAAWRDAVDNFRRELDQDDDPVGRAAAMRRDLTTAEQELARVEAELDRTRRQHAEEDQAARRCQRQETMARDIGDLETAELAARFAERHAQRARVFLQKLQALEAEASLRHHDVHEMRQRWARTAHDAALDHANSATPGKDDSTPPNATDAASTGTHTRAPHTTDPDPLADPLASSFDHLEQDAREKAAARRLDELKRRTR